MLERYIEKNIFRQVYLCQQLYQKKEVFLKAWQNVWMYVLLQSIMI